MEKHSTSATTSATIPHLPDGPKSPSIVQLLRWILQPTQLLESGARRYGDLFTVDFGFGYPLIMVSDPAAIQAIFKTDPRQFEVGIANNLLLPLVGNESILLLDGDRHQRQRQLLSPPFHGDRMRTYASLICEITRQATQKWSQAEPILVRETMQEISLQVILHTVFGLSAGDRYHEIQQRVRSLLEKLGSPLSSSLLFLKRLQQDWGRWSPWGNFLQERSQIDALLYAEIEARRQTFNPEQEDVLTLLLSARDEAGQPMSDVELRDELMTLLLAGHETTASALTWAFYWIHHTPGVLDRLQTELATADWTDPLSLIRLPYLNAICQETLRIYPIAPIAFPRIVKAPFQLMGYELPSGTALMPCIYLTHRRPNLYPEPEQFRPERFLERQFSPYEYLPFGGSNRRCLGMALAQVEMKLVLATVLSHHQLCLSPDQPLRPVRRGVTLAPPSSFKMALKA